MAPMFVVNDGEYGEKLVNGECTEKYVRLKWENGKNELINGKTLMVDIEWS